MTPLSHGAVSHASAAHTTTVANHMAGLTSPPAWVSPQPPVHLPAPLPPAAPPLPPSVPAPPPPASLPPVPPAPVPALTNGIGPVLAKVLTLVAVLAGVAGVRFAVAHAFSAASDPPPTGLAGTWQDPTGGTFTITANGDGTYSFHTPCTTVTLAGSGDTYTGQQTLYDASNPGACIQIGYVTDTFTLDPGGQQIEAVKTVPPGEKDPNGNPIGNCDDCGTSTLTRAPSS